MGKFTRPPAQATSEDFINGAETRTASSTKNVSFPSAGGPRSGALSLRLTPRETAVLRWLAEHGTRSQHQIVLDAVQRAIEADYRQIADSPDFHL
jgi:hypothetical protein